MSAAQLLEKLIRSSLPHVTYIRKFGENPDIDTADGVVDVWNFPTAKTYTFSSSADIDTVSSSNAGDTDDLTVFGLDTNWEAVTQTVTMTGQTKVTLTTPLIRVYRMVWRGAADAVGNIYCYVDGAITGGVPDTAADVRAYIAAGDNQTLMGIYTIPANWTAFALGLTASLSKSPTGAGARVITKARPFGESFQIKSSAYLSGAGSSAYTPSFEIPVEVPAKTDLIASASVAANGTGVAGSFELVLVKTSVIGDLL